MKMLKRMISVILVCSLVLPVSGITAGATDGGAYLYTEDFSGTVDDLKTAGWTSGSDDNFYYDIVENELVYDGTANVRYLYLNSANAVTWSNYTVEVDVMMTSDVVQGFTANGRWAGIIVGAESGSNHNLKSGYEFALQYAKNSSKFSAMIRERKDNSTDGRPTDSTLTNYSMGTTYTLKVVVDGATITCYIDDDFQFTWDTGSNVVGTIGLSTQGHICKFDNLKVYPTGSEPTQDNYYNVAFYRGERETFINPLKENDTFDGWYEDADFTTPLDDDVKDGYAYVKWASDSIPVVPDVPDGAYLYTEDFSGTLEDLKTAGWTSGSDDKFYYDIVGNELVYDGTANTRYLYLDSANAVTWSNYTVEVDVMLTSTPVENFTSVSRWAGITVGAKSGSNNNSKSGYEFAFSYRDETDDTKNKFVTMIRDRKDSSSTNRPSDKNYTTGYNLDQTYTLKMVVDGTQIHCYVDNVFQFTWDTGSAITGTIGLSTQGNICKFDNLRVYKTESGPWFKDTFSSISGWGDMSDTHLSNGTALFADGYKYLSENILDNQESYTVEVKATITDGQTTTNGTSRIASLIVAAPTDSESSAAGYEFMIASQLKDTDGDSKYDQASDQVSSTYCQLMDRTGNGKNSSKQSPAIELGETYTLKMVVSQTKILCYINEELMIDYDYQGTETNPFATGTIGLRATKNKVAFDDVSVRPGTQEDCNYYDVSFYRKGLDEVIHPFKEDVVFGGWYTDAAFTTPLSTSAATGKAYAKWVDAGVLTAKAQLDADTTADSAKTSMRFVTTIDESLDYDKVGFIINGAKYGETATVYRTLLAREGLNVVECSLSDFSTDSAYFAAVTLENIPLFKDLDGNGVLDAGETDNKDTAIVVTPYWITADGTTVSGTTRNDITINLGLATLAQPYGL